jgi:hypothetical protein
VTAAGEVEIVGGEVKWLDNTSGCYLPSGESARGAAEAAFEEVGFAAAGKYVEKYWNEVLERWVKR